jgi:hypothetical protein
MTPVSDRQEDRGNLNGMHPQSINQVSLMEIPSCVMQFGETGQKAHERDGMKS